MDTLRHVLGATVVALALVVGAGASVAAAASGTLSISSNTTLTADYYGQIVIAADNVTLDCAGHAVVGPGTVGTTTGVLLLDRSFVTVRNCRVSGFDVGIAIESSDTGAGSRADTLAGNTATGNGSGFSVLHASDVTLSGNTARANDGGGFGVIHTDAVLDHNVAVGNGGNGFAFGSTGTITLTTNLASGNADSGFSFSHSGGPLTGNVAHGNGAYGFEFNSSEVLATHDVSNNNGGGFRLGPRTVGSTFAHNIANNNTTDGFSLAGAYDNALTQNIANSNTLDGFRLSESSHDNVLSGNVAHANGGWDAQDDVPVLNAWTDNNFGKTNPAALG